MKSIGLDIGSRTIKMVMVEDGQVTKSVVMDTTVQPLKVCNQILDGQNYDGLTVTGYGRHLFLSHWPGSRAISEIKAVAMGICFTQPHTRGIIDVGGQDTKAITLDNSGKIGKFSLNDRCAAGTGIFLEMMATALAYTQEEFCEIAGQAQRSELISAMCSVFAQTEVVSLVARGAKHDEIALGIHCAAADRIAAMAGTISLADPVAFTGGGALNTCLVKLLSQRMKKKLFIPPHPQIIAALGCAIFSERNISLYDKIGE